MLYRTLAEADASIRSGDKDRIEAAFERVENLFDLYSRRYADNEGDEEAASAIEVRRTIERTLSTLLRAIDRSLSSGNLDMARAALRQAGEAINVTAELDNEHRLYSGIRRRFPSKPPK
jgi:hypothetical protein